MQDNGFNINLALDSQTVHTYLFFFLFEFYLLINLIEIINNLIIINLIISLFIY